MDPSLPFFALIFLLGSSIGSFLNVVIYRLPHGLSLVRPASRCPSCGAPIRLWHNVPVFGWLMLRGRCADCHVKISARYPLIELLTGILFLALWHDLIGGFTTTEVIASGGFLMNAVIPFVLYSVFVAGLIAIAFIDLDYFVIPDVMSLPAIPLGLLVTYAAGHGIGVSMEDALIGALSGAGVIVAIIVIYGALTGREGMGGGDWKLLGAIGAWLGWQALPMVLFMASIQGILVTLIVGRALAVDELPPMPGEADDEGAESAPAEAKAVGQLAVPFGPFLALAAIEALLFREEWSRLLANLTAIG
ncbi:MAG: prepilin peptidase [Deltaproteobacteria bacterium]|nr:prepilin peptidase [Deltaproteobacteria bacterium]